jgi:hypothetical protein
MVRESATVLPEYQRLDMLSLDGIPGTHVEVFPKMNHGQLLIDHPEEIAARISQMVAI